MSVETIDRDIDGPITAPPATARRSRSRRRIVVSGLAAVLLLAAPWYGYHWWTVGRFVETTDDAYVGGDVTPIAPHVSGFVARLLVADNQYVRAGQPLLRLDPRDFQAARDHAAAIVQERRAALADLEAKTALQQATIRQARADLAARQAAAAFATQDAVRYRILAQSDAGSLQAAQKALSVMQAAQAAVAAARAALAAARQQSAVLATEITGAKAAIVQANADLRTARLDLGYTRIAAPIDGYIGNRYAQTGAYVVAGTTLLSIIPARGLWVDANFKEDELARMKPGQPATLVADVLPGHVFHGRVATLAPATGAVFSVIPPQNATGNFTKIVQRVPVRIALDGKAATLGLLRPGLSMTVSVHTKPHGVHER